MKHVIKILNLENLPSTRPIVAMNNNGNLKWEGAIIYKLTFDAGPGWWNGDYEDTEPKTFTTIPGQTIADVVPESILLLQQPQFALIYKFEGWLNKADNEPIDVSMIITEDMEFTPDLTTK